MDMHIENAIKVGKLETEMNGLREQQKSHYTDLSAEISAITIKVDSILEYINKSKGALTFLLIIAGASGAALMKALGFLFSKFGN